jgi:hypothetical protein
VKKVSFKAETGACLRAKEKGKPKPVGFSQV